MDPLRVVVRRGDVVEAVHLVHVASTDGVLTTARTSSASCARRRSRSRRSRLLEAYDDLDDDELAIACASHQAEPAQLAAVRKLLARAGATVDDLENGAQEGRPEGKLGHNCSGKHAGFLAACRANGWPFGGYRLPGHPAAGAASASSSAAASRRSTAAGSRPTRCRSPPQARAPDAARRRGIAERDARAAGARRRRRRRRHRADASCCPGWIAKRGAEGLLCAAAPDGRGYAFKVADGNGRALRPALAAVLGRRRSSLRVSTCATAGTRPVGSIELA